jgi:enoyl-CoA hydratase
MSELVQYTALRKIGLIRMDDGRLNIMSLAMLEAVADALDRAERDGAVVILAGREGIFSAGFDLKVLRGPDVDQHWRMLKAGAELALRLLAFPTPVVCACTGHALPMGAFLMLASDLRIGAEGPFSIGLNEVAIGLTLPQFAIELARQRLSPAYYNRGLMTGERFAPEEAVRAGYLDLIVPAEQLQERVLAAATALTAIDLRAHVASKLKARKHAIHAVRAAIDEELTYENFMAHYADASPGVL